MSGSISFQYFPAASWRVPGFYPEFNANQANTAAPNQRALLIGQVLASGSAVLNQPILAYSQAQVSALCGLNAMLTLMYQTYRLQDGFGEVWILPLADNAAGTAATATIAFTGPATTSGLLSLYIAGILVGVAVTVGDTAATIAANLVADMALIANLPCTATAAAGTVTLTALHRGRGAERHRSAAELSRRAQQRGHAGRCRCDHHGVCRWPAEPGSDPATRQPGLDHVRLHRGALHR
jgi:phage tail sheath gpL-like